MKLSEKIFNERKFPTVKPSMFSSEQGYDVNSVELYLEELAIEIEKLEKENERLKEENYANATKKEYVDVSSTLNAKEETQQEVAAKLAEPLEDNKNKNLEMKYQERMEKLALKERSINRLLDAAQEDNLKIKREAKEEAKEIVMEAQEKATKILTEANMRCKEKENEMMNIENASRELRERLINIQGFIGEIVNKKAQ